MGNCHIGYILSEAAMDILEAGIDAHFHSIDPTFDSGGQFRVYQSSCSSDIYEVTDAEQQLVFDLLKENLEDSSFDLIGWYLAQLEEGGLYNSWYLASMIELNCINEEDPEGLMITSEPNFDPSSGDKLLEDWSDIDSSKMKPWGSMGDALLF